ncbi:CAF17-like 4Fe-4S cluster assembly/insertion protein YgfZ [Indioceanicola profundi]|uniref:CAF17-like 4Fe-4S cluster assembly/insertion protein YgfZ n=1 Tax=Indioceanicola profundi TaxID=2220096 RepID=UPI001CECDDDC|nr:folate-binding protein [Indioceanicola profundi]
MAETTTPITLPAAPPPDLPEGVRVAALPGTGVLRVAGEDRIAFLQGLVSNDVSAVAEDRAVWSAFLTPQGKYLHDFFIAAQADALLILCEAERRGDLFRRLRMYRLRSKVELADVTEQYGAALAFGTGAAAAFGLPAAPGAAAAAADGIAFVDPRRAELGVRIVLPRGSMTGLLDAYSDGSLAEWDRIRLALGVPDGSRDLVPEKSILLESGFDELQGVSWTKGCYMGQELTARTKYRGLVKKRLMPVLIEGPLPPPGTQILADGKDAGEMRSGIEGLGLALVRLDAAAGSHPLEAAGTRLQPLKPAWAGF